MSKQLNEDQLYTRRYSSLSARDLLDARDTYHVHLAHKQNVIATAIGLYLIRHKDPDADNSSKTREAVRSRGSNEERTLENSKVCDWSWPCVLVFVSEWQKEEDFRKHPEHVVPPFLFMEDGRIIPVCVVKANVADVRTENIDPAKLDTDVLSGGSPVFVEAQGQRRMGSIGCIVTDGTDYFALTNKHVAGEGGRNVYANFRGIGKPVGLSQQVESLGATSFSTVYPSLPGRETYINLDAGLIKINRVADWSTGVRGFKEETGPMLDFSGDTASLDWIGCAVVAHGASSGDLRGEIRALFYRYKTVGGREYISDFLIGSPTSANTKARKSNAPKGEHSAEAPRPLTAPGDSGTVWFRDPEHDPQHRLRPLALQWGGQKLSSNGSGSATYTQFALASSVAVISRELGVDIVADWRTEHVQYWGAVGHFKIAQQACFHVTNAALKRFLQDNLDNISFSDDSALTGATHLNALKFVPLSDVPDIVWKTNVNRVKREVTRANENPNHFADVDMPGGDGQSLLEICGDPPNLDLEEWITFYKNAKPPKDSPPGRNGGPATLQHGCLPFRVWQIFAAMQQFAAADDAVKFLCAAGIIAHYVGDACQPLHGSQHSDGLFGARTGVHSTYEDHMVELHADDIASGVDQVISDEGLDLIAVKSGQEAGQEIVNLMRRCHENLAPETICNSYNHARPGTHTSPTTRKDVLDAMWGDLGDGTCKCIADGIRVLASIWESAFQSAGSESAFTGQIPRKKLQNQYEQPENFLPSRHLEHFTQEDLPPKAKKKAA